MISGTRYQLQREVNRQLRLATEIARTQAQISTGKRLLAPSDDPVAAARISELNRAEADQAAWRSNLDGAAAAASNAEGVLDGLVTAFDRVNELMLSVSNGTLSAANREAIALELESIAEEVATLRGSRDTRGQPLFPPAAAAIRIPVGPDLHIAAVASREAVFDTIATPAGTSSLTAILGAAVAAVRGGNPAAIAASLGATNAASGHAISAHAQQGSRGARIDALIERFETAEVARGDERARVEGADVPELVARIQTQQLSLDAAQAVFARINRSTLFDLLT